jgi:hypothetical protein
MPLGQARGDHTTPQSTDQEQQERRRHREEDIGSTTNDDPNIVSKASYMGGNDGASTA